MLILGIRSLLLEYAVFDSWLSVGSMQRFQKSWYRGMWPPPSDSCYSSLYPKVLLHSSKLLVPPKNSSASPDTCQPVIWPMLLKWGCPLLALCSFLPLNVSSSKFVQQLGKYLESPFNIYRCLVAGIATSFYISQRMSHASYFSESVTASYITLGSWNKDESFVKLLYLLLVSFSNHIRVIR